MAKNEQISFMSFQKRFSTEEACREYLFQQRWPNGFVCPKCGGVGCYPMKSRNEYVCKSDPKPLAWIHTVISNFKASFQGTCHGLGKKYIQPYLDEFCYRFNRKRWHKELFSRLLSAVVNSNIGGLAD